MSKSHTIGASVRARRLELGLSQQAVADMAGKRQQTVCDLENGHYSPLLDTLTAIAGALDISVSALLLPYSPPKR